MKGKMEMKDKLEVDIESQIAAEIERVTKLNALKKAGKCKHVDASNIGRLKLKLKEVMYSETGRWSYDRTIAKRKAFRDARIKALRLLDPSEIGVNAFWVAERETGIDIVELGEAVQYHDLWSQKTTHKNK